MKRVVLTLLVITIACMAGCSTAVHRSSLSKQDFKTQVKTVVLTDLNLPDALQHRQDVSSYYLQQIREIFARNNIQVIAPEVYYSVFNEMRDANGGYFNAQTGQRDDEKFAKVQRETLARLKQSHNIDAVLYHDIRVRNANFGQYRAEWDGQSEAYEKNNNDAANFFSSLVQQTSGRLPAISYLVFIKDVQAKELYMGAGGIQLVSKLNNQDKFEPLPLAELLQDSSTMAFSVTEALRKLLDEKQI
jgi:hypothetical protein